MCNHRFVRAPFHGAHGGDPGLFRWHHRQSIGPTLLIAVVDSSKQIIFDFVCLVLDRQGQFPGCIRDIVIPWRPKCNCRPCLLKTGIFPILTDAKRVRLLPYVSSSILISQETLSVPDEVPDFPSSNQVAEELFFLADQLIVGSNKVLLGSGAQYLDLA